MPTADIVIDATLVRSLLQEQHPDLAELPLKLVANGWDNAIYRLGGELCIRLPRREVAVQLIVNEQRWLPSLAPRLGVPIPVPVRAGVPGQGYPWPWSITSWVAGDLATGQSSPVLAMELAGFFKRLHVPAPADAPHNHVRGVPLSQRDQAVRERLDAFEHSEVLRRRWNEALDAPLWTAPPVWVHGDAHPANLLVHNGHLAAVLDFGDLCAGDPATDVAVAWLALDAADRAIFHEHYQPDPATWIRARGWAVNLGTAIAVHSDDAPHMAAIAAHTLAQVLVP
jgi:aminoglycoside phosphotransferase (APT) family kinase protein